MHDGGNGGPLLVDPHPDDRMTYIKWHIRDFLNGVRGLKPDQIGMYTIILNLLYDNMGSLRDDDRYIASHCKCEVRYYRKLRDVLLAEKKIYEADGYLYNNRALAEIAEFCASTRRKREAAMLREQQKREAAMAAARLREQQMSQSSPNDARRAREACAAGARQARGALAMGAHQDVNETKKVNEINANETTGVPEPSTYKDKEKEKEYISTPLPPKGGKFVDPVDEQFEVWWKAFPDGRKIGKGECAQLFRQAVTGFRHKGRKGDKLAQHGRVSAEQLIEAARRYAQTNPDPRYVPAPATWLNQGRWLDDPKPQVPPPSNGYANGHANGHAQQSGDGKRAEPWWWKGKEDKVRKLPLPVWRKAIETYGQAHWAEEYLGPPPGSEGCLVAPDIAAELKLHERYAASGGLLL